MARGLVEFTNLPSTTHNSLYKDNYLFYVTTGIFPLT